ncbi:MAG: RNA polymerase sigma factor [Myxococcota bacterium]
MDPELQDRLKQSDTEALRELYREFSPTVFALCLRMLRDRQRAEEVMQDTFWQIWSKPDQFDPARGKLSTFLTQVARNRCLDRLRAERSRTERVRSATEELDPRDVMHAVPTPLQSAIDLEDRHLVRRALSGLEAKTRDVVVLRYFEGLSHIEIAERTGSPLGTVKTRVRRGLLQLRKDLAGAMPV